MKEIEMRIPKSLLTSCFQIAGLACLSLILLTPPALWADFVVNGSFEADSFTGSGVGYRLGLSGNDVTGWFIPASDGVYPWGLQNINAFGAGPAADGNQWLVLGRYDTGAQYTIQQELTGLSAGSTYLLSFAIASESGCCSNAEVSFLSGSSTAAQMFQAPNSGSYWTAWGAESMSFLATSTSVTLQFKNVSPSLNDGIDLGLDNVHVESVNGVPEPAFVGSVSVMIGGLLVVAWRRRAKII
jgi:uncharacterized protein DUF642